MKLDGQPMLCVRYTSSNGMKYVTLVDYSGIRATTLVAVSVTILCILAAVPFNIGRQHRVDRITF